jgi:hypothetical protein
VTLLDRAASIEGGVERTRAVESKMRRGGEGMGMKKNYIARIKYQSYVATKRVV